MRAANALRDAILSAALVTAALAAALLAPPGAIAFAQDAPKAPPAAEEPAPPHAETLRLRAIDLSAMYDQSAGGTRQAADVALASRPVKALWRSAKGAETIDLATDADGRFEVPLAGMSPGTPIEFIVPETGAGARWPLYASVPVTVGEAPPSELVFVRVHEGENPLACGSLMLVVTAPDREEGKASLRVNLIAAVENRSERLWIGSKDGLERGTLRFRIPKGLLVVGAQVAGRDTKVDVVQRPDGAQDAILRERFWPTVFSDKPTGVRLVLTGPYQETDPYDFSFEAEVPVEEFRLNLESGVFSYIGGDDGVELANAGANPEIQGRVTIGWTAGHIHRGQKVAVRFRVGTGALDSIAAIHPNVWYTLGTLALVIAGATFLAKALARRTVPAQAASPAAAPPSADDREAKLRELDRRLAKGEITSFEHAARTRQLEGASHRTSRAAAAPAASERRPLDDISARVDTADAETLRRDVRSLLAMLRGREK